MGRGGCLALAAGLSLALGASGARAAASDPADLLELSLEELMNVQVTSVSRRSERLAGAPAAIYVLTAEDIRRAGYTRIPEALRMVPGLDVVRTRSSDWSIGARGFSSGFSNKLLVQVDGRSVYSPLFGGVFWELQHVPLDELDRIEVIRGPGGTLWGANAVNGIINIITKPAGEKRGGASRMGAGSGPLVIGETTFGGAAGEGLALRGSAAFRYDGGQASPAGFDDDWTIGQLQGRGDWRASERDSLTFLGGFFQGDVAEQANNPVLSPCPPCSLPFDRGTDKTGAHLVGRWARELEEDSDLALQLFWDFTDLEFASVREKRHTVDLDFQHRFPFWTRNEITWGLGYRVTVDELDETIRILEPDQRDVHVWSGFLQDRIALIPDTLEFTAGTKIEHNPYTGFEFQPSGRLAYTPHEAHTVWAAVSRAVRSPTRLDDDGDLVAGAAPGAPDPTLFVLMGDGRFVSETVVAYELGYRATPLENVSVDVAAFYNDYEDLLNIETGTPFMATDPIDHTVMPFIFDNQLRGWSTGVEAAIWWQALPWLRLQAWYAFLHVELQLAAGSTDITNPEAQEDQTPLHRAFLRGSVDLPHEIDFDLMLHVAGERPGIEAMVDMDARLAWRPCPGWELSLLGRNLLHDDRFERIGVFNTPVERAVYGQIRWEY